MEVRVLDQVREVVLVHRGAVFAPHIEHVLVLDALGHVHPIRKESPRHVEGHSCNVAQPGGGEGGNLLRVRVG